MVCKWADDSQRFILEYFDGICDCPYGIYHCAIPFSPSSSWLHDHYSPGLLQGVKVVKGTQAEWGVCSRTVFLNDTPLALTCWKDLVAVGCISGDIVILDAITGITMSTLSSHTGEVNSVAFSSDGTCLVSGSDDKTVILWDVQTGGVARTFHGHTKLVLSVSISPDCTMIASGSCDHTIWLWYTQTGECHCVIEGHSDIIHSVNFFPTNSQLLISASRDGTVKQWDVDGHQVGSAYEGNYVVFSPDGTYFVSWDYGGNTVTVWDSDSGKVVAILQSYSGDLHHCCLFPDGKYVVSSAGNTIYTQGITNPNPCLVETFIGHTGNITSLAFSSSLISSSEDRSIKFWQTGTSSANQVTIDSESTSLASVSIKSVSLQTTEGIAISSDSVGVVKTWDISTGLCKESFQTPAKGSTWRDAQLMDGRLTFVWFETKRLYIWDAEKGELLRTLDTPYWQVKDLRISGDGSKVFLLHGKSIQVWTIQTGEVVGGVKFEGQPLHDSLIVDGSRAWVHFWDLCVQGWDFGLPGSTPIPLSNTLPDRPRLCIIGTIWQNTSPLKIEDRVTGKKIFQLSGRYAKPDKIRWDGRYLVAGYESGEVLILDFIHMIPQ